LVCNVAGESDSWTELSHGYISIGDIVVSSPNLEEARYICRPRGSHSFDTSLRVYASEKDYYFFRADFYAYGLRLEDDNVGHIYARHSSRAKVTQITDPTSAVARFCDRATFRKASTTSLLLAVDCTAVMISPHTLQMLRSSKVTRLTELFNIRMAMDKHLL
jgi:hypothetical protein